MNIELLVKEKAIDAVLFMKLHLTLNLNIVTHTFVN